VAAGHQTAVAFGEVIREVPAAALVQARIWLRPFDIKIDPVALDLAVNAERFLRIVLVIESADPPVGRSFSSLKTPRKTPGKCVTSKIPFQPLKITSRRPTKRNPVQESWRVPSRYRPIARLNAQTRTKPKD
jgi:hypothetical protein